MTYSHLLEYAFPVPLRHILISCYVAEYADIKINEVIFSGGIRSSRHERKFATDMGSKVHTQLEEADQKHAALLESITDAFVALDRDWRYTYVNANASFLIGKTREELVGKVMWEVFPRLSDRISRELHRCVVENVPVHVEGYNPEKQRWYENHCYPSPEGVSIFFQDITERKKIEQALRESEEQFRFAEKIAKMGHFEWNVPNDVITASPSLEVIHGVPPGSFEGGLEDWLKFVHPEDKIAIQDFIRDVFKRRCAEEEFEVRILRPNGEVRYLAVRASATYEGEGPPARIVGVMTDVTERKEVQDALRVSEERLRLALKGANQGIWDWNPETKAIVWDERCKEIFGLSPDFSIDCHSNLEAIHPEDRERVYAAFQAAFRSHSEFNEEYRVLLPDGSIRWVFDRGRPFDDENGRTSRMTGTVLDITDRKELEEKLRESLERLVLAQEAGQVGVFDTDLLTRHIIWTPQLEKIFGLREGTFENILEGWTKRVHPEDLPGLESLFQDWIQSRRTEAEWEYRFIRPDGEVRWIHAKGKIIRDAKGKAIRMIGSDVDITERKRAEEALQQRTLELQKLTEELEKRVAERTAALEKMAAKLEMEMNERQAAEEKLIQAQKLEAIGTMAGGIAHDFNNLLAAMITNVELAIMDLPEETRAHANLHQSLKAGLEARDLIKQILMFSRKSSGEEKVLSLGNLLEETFALLRSSIPTTIAMELKRDVPEPDTIYANASEIQQVIVNLCTNAAHAMRGKAGKLEIKLTHEEFSSKLHAPDFDMEAGDYLVISVKDTGHGMSEKVKERIFEPFFTTKKPGEGSGLGLSVVYGIVKKYKGGIAVYSKPDTGSLFKVYLPKKDLQAISLQPEPEKTLPKGTERILLIDDEEIVLKAVTHMLQRLGYHVASFSSSLEALKFFSENRDDIDLVVTDQTMPSMTGEDFAKAVMRVRPQIPVILCTGYDELMTEGKVREIGISGFVLKPFTLREGAHLVRRILDEREKAK